MTAIEQVLQKCLHKNSPNYYRPGLCPNAERALSNVIAIHWYENYTEAQVKQIAAAITKVAGYFRGRGVTR